MSGAFPTGSMAGELKEPAELHPALGTIQFTVEFWWKIEKKKRTQLDIQILLLIFLKNQL